MHIEDFINLQNDFNKNFEFEENKVQKLSIALMVEVAEFLNELSDFKYWKNNHKINKQKLYEEFSDIFLIWCSIANELELNQDELNQAILNKIVVNNNRQRDSY